MKSIIKVAFLFFTFTLVSCGQMINGLNIEENQSFYSKLNVQTTTPPSEFVGIWNGDINGVSTTINISNNGSALLSIEGQSLNEAIVKNSSGQYFITDTNYKQLLRIEVDSTGYLDELIMHDPDGIEHYFYK